MPIGIIRGQTATSVNVTVGTGDWTQVFRSVRTRGNLPQIDATTYATEQNGAFIAGLERYTFELSGLMTRGVAASGPLMPMSAYQGVNFIIAYDAGCSVQSIVNASDSELDRPAGQMGTIGATVVNTGPVTITWNKTTSVG